MDAGKAGGGGGGGKKCVSDAECVVQPAAPACDVGVRAGRGRGMEVEEELDPEEGGGMEKGTEIGVVHVCSRIPPIVIQRTGPIRN